MGASAWVAATRWTGDLDEALLRAKRDVFAEGRFRDPWGMVASPDAAIALLRKRVASVGPGMPPEILAQLGGIDELRADVEAEIGERITGIEAYAAAEGEDARIEALRVAAGFEGTHSVIDLESTRDLEPLDRDALQARFGTVRPSLDEALAQAMELADRIGRFAGLWFLAGEAPDEHVVFVGVSGD